MFIYVCTVEEADECDCEHCFTQSSTTYINKAFTDQAKAEQWCKEYNDNHWGYASWTSVELEA